ncbi:MAG: single-stranded DNA-binding protein [Patescibacteria group bacterium]
MARSINKAIIIGNLTRDPEMRYTPDGQAVTSFGVATNRAWTSKDGEKKEEAEFHNLVAWGKLAEICSQILKKGRRVYVEGRLQTRSWEGKDGAQRQRTEIVIEDMVALDPKPEGGEGPAVTEAPSEEQVPVIQVESEDKEKAKGKAKAPKEKHEEISEDEIPF